MKISNQSIFYQKAKIAIGLATALALSACNPTGNDNSQKSSSPSSSTDTAMAGCPQGLGWAEGLGAYTNKAKTMPVSFPANADDCLFQQWSWEAFVWATADVGNNRLRFMDMKTIEQLDSTTNAVNNSGLLNLHPRSTKAHNITGEYAAAFVEADGSMLVGQNGYPVYASIHMNDSYFNTAKANMISNGGFAANADKIPGTDKDGYFELGAAVFKATWYRLDEKETAPEGAYVTNASVPVLKSQCNDGGCIAVINDDVAPVTARVALVGLHVVGYVENHPEFIWATFEHNRNAPMFDDGTFKFDGSSDPNDYTFYKGGTPYTKDKVLVVNQPNTPNDEALLKFDEASQTFSPITQIVQMNKTGGDNQTNGPANILAVNTSSQTYLKGQGSTFQNYRLIGSVWLDPNSYIYNKEERATGTGSYSNSLNEEAVGGISLANSTAETFMQSAGKGDTQNCFLCHNAQSYNFGSNKGKLPVRLIAISHAIANKAPFNVPNQIAVKDKGAQPTSE